MTDSHTQEGQVQRAKRLRALIEDLKSGKHAAASDHEASLREQIEDRAHKVLKNEENSSH